MRFGRVIKLSESHANARALRHAQPTGRIVNAEVTQAAVRAKRLVADAETNIAERRLAFEKSLESMRDELQGQARAEAELSLAAKVIEVAALRQRSLERARDDIVELAKLMAERVIGETLTMSPERLVTMARRCIDESRGSSHIVVLAHPREAVLLGQQLEGLDPAIEIHVEPEPALKPGDLRIETDVGTLDAKIGTQLASLAAKIRESLRI